MEYATASSLAKKSLDEMQKAAKLAKIDLDVFLWYEQFSSSASEAAATLDRAAMQRNLQTVKKYATDSEFFERHRNLP
jgi:3-oxoacyl-[acyl-carrier-protein] synthase III